MTTDIKNLQARIKELEDVFRMNDAWPLTDVLQKLIDGTDILLHQKDYDALGWESYEHAFKLGKEILQQIKYIKPTLAMNPIIEPSGDTGELTFVSDGLPCPPYCPKDEII